MSARDTLAREIFLTDNHKYRDQAAKEWDAGDRPEYVYGIADGLLKAGWTKPRTITTVEELDKLANDTVVRDNDGNTAERTLNNNNDPRWYFTGEPRGVSEHDIQLPATVLYEPQP